MQQFCKFKVPFLGLFFIICIQPSLCQDTSQRWKNLLYLQDGKPLINDHSFYFDQNFTNPKKLLNTLKDTSHDQKYLCRYPARFYWLSKKQNLNLNFDHCRELNDFINRAPLDRAFILFASENINSPTSMMGHIYLDIEGKSASGIHKKHSISFFINTENDLLFKLIFQTLISGKKGHYALSPSFILENNYLKQEKRNLWKYELRLTEFQKKLLHYHLYELKNIELIYYFNRFNCATLIDRILRVIYPDKINDSYTWISPLEVVRNINEFNLIKSQTVKLSQAWKIKAINQEKLVSKKTVGLIKKKSFKKIQIREDKNINFLNYQLAKSYSLYLYNDKNIQKNDFENLDNDLEHLRNSFPDNTYLSLHNYKNPMRTNSFSFYALGYNSRNQLLLEYMPLSHSLSDDQSQYLSSSELKILDTSLRLQSNSLDINYLTLYSSTYLIPHDPLISSLSTHFSLQISDEITSNYIFEESLNSNLMAGKSFMLTRDLMCYILLGGRIWHNNIVQSSPLAEHGLILNQIFNSKTIIKNQTYLLDSNIVSKIQFIESLLFKKSKLNFEINHIATNARSINNLILIYYKFF